MTDNNLPHLTAGSARPEINSLSSAQAQGSKASPERRLRFSELMRRFSRLTRQWRAETRYLSSVEEITAHPAYREIVSMGPDVLPLIFEFLERNPAEHWFAALKEITGADPVPEADRGNLARMAQCWLKWREEVL